MAHSFGAVRLVEPLVTQCDTCAYLYDTCIYIYMYVYIYIYTHNIDRYRYLHKQKKMHIYPRTVYIYISICLSVCPSVRSSVRLQICTWFGEWHGYVQLGLNHRYCHWGFCRSRKLFASSFTLASALANGWGWTLTKIGWIQELSKCISHSELPGMC